jgi:hypothetical protein
MKTKENQLPAENQSRGTVWVVTIELAERILAVGSNKATALHWAGVRASEFLNHKERKLEGGQSWNPSTVVEYFGYRATELEIDGDGRIWYETLEP